MYGIDYRPVDFNSVLGLEDAKEILRAYLREQNYDPAYLFAGSHASGKTTLGQIFARSILCESRQEDMSPCNTCSSCKAFLSGKHTGYLEVDSALGSGKENIEQILESLDYESVTRHKIILFDEAHNLSREAKDALLKRLERKDNAIFIFCTTEYEKMVPTLRSRCSQFQLHEPTEESVIQKLQMICEKEGLSYTPDGLMNIVKATGRHYRDAENRLRQVTLLGPVDEENVKRATSVYVDEIIALMLSLSYDLNKAIQMADFLTSRMNIRIIYDWMLRILNDTIKRMSGISFGNTRYDELLKMMQKQYATSAYEILDYILSKNRLSDLTLFQSDLLIIHYKFLRDAFAPKDLKDLTQVSTPEVKTSASSNEKNQGVKSVKEIQNLPRGVKEDVVREYRMNKRKEARPETVEERVGEAWGPEVKKDAAPLVHRREVTRKEFREALKGTLNEGNSG